MLRQIAATLLVPALAACGSASQEFDRSTISALVLGQTTRSDVVARLGEPDSMSEPTPREAAGPIESRSVFEPASVDGARLRLRYRHHPNVVEWGAYDRTLSLGFYNDTLTDYRFESTFPEDAADFDASLLAKIQRGVSTSADVIALFGTPIGRAIYPAIQRPGDQGMMYIFETTDWTMINFKMIMFVFDRDGRVVDYNYRQARYRNPRMPEPSYFPIFPPHIYHK